MNFNKLIKNKEYDFLRTNHHLGENICLLGLGGSYAYGTNVKDSDVDIRGIAVRAKEDILLGKDFETIVDAKTDTTIYSLDKVFGLLSNCNPNVIEIVSLKPEQYLYVNEIGQKILHNKNIFLSKKCIQTFGGYANQQLYRLQQRTLAALSEKEYNEHISKVLNGMQEHLKDKYHLSVPTYVNDDGQIMMMLNFLNRETLDIPLENIAGILSEMNNTLRDYTKTSKRNEHALAHNKINKHAMHLIRLYAMANDLLENGEVITFREKEHDLLMDIRNGKYSKDNGQMSKEFFDIVKAYEDKFNILKTITKLPEEPDYAAINNLRCEINEMIILNLMQNR